MLGHTSANNAELIQKNLFIVNIARGFAPTVSTKVQACLLFSTIKHPHLQKNLSTVASTPELAFLELIGGHAPCRSNPNR